MEARPHFMRSNTVTSFGRVISVRGSLARVGLLAPGQVLVSEARATVGRFISIRCAAATTIIAMITEVSCESPSTSDEYIATASVDLLGEISGGERPKFQRGVTNYPTIGDAVDLVTAEDLRTVYAPSGSDQINIGTLQQDKSVIAYVDVEEMLSKHFAVLGSTGASANRPAYRCCSTRFSRRGRTCVYSCSTSTTNMAAASATARWCSTRAI